MSIGNQNKGNSGRSSNSNSMLNIGESMSQMTDGLTKILASGNSNKPGQQGSNLLSPLSVIAEKATEPFGQQKSQDLGQASSDYLQTNSLIAKFGFLIGVLIAFVIILRLGSILLQYFILPSDNPHLIDGTREGRSSMVIPMNPANHDSKPIMRSKSQTQGIEFTWSIWIYIKHLGNNSHYQHIFHKGNNNMETEACAGPSNNLGTTDLTCDGGDVVDSSNTPPTSVGNKNSCGINKPNNAPGLYIVPCKNQLAIRMNTFNDYENEVIVDNIPIKKWLSVIIRVKNRVLDVYINGAIAKRVVLKDTPKQNYGDVYVGATGSNEGFDGKISDLWYFSKALGPGEILRLLQDGPNLNSSSSGIEDPEFSNFPPYLSLKWYFKDDPPPIV
tara:strand:+ start:235 stop:1395 length:1161 start_codon:yes stop_codon:yes gene_type:complete